MRWENWSTRRSGACLKDFTGAQSLTFTYGRHTYHGHIWTISFPTCCGPFFKQSLFLETPQPICTHSFKVRSWSKKWNNQEHVNACKPKAITSNGYHFGYFAIIRLPMHVSLFGACTIDQRLAVKMKHNGNSEAFTFSLPRPTAAVSSLTRGGWAV